MREEFLEEKALRLIYDYLPDTDPYNIKVVWFCKTLQNWKAMVADISPDGMFFEVTYNGNKKEAYIDAYKKFENVCVPD